MADRHAAPPDGPTLQWHTHAAMHEWTSPLRWAPDTTASGGGASVAACSRKVWQHCEEHGLCWVRGLPDALRLVRDDPRRLVERLLGVSPVYTKLHEIRPKPGRGPRAYAGTQDDALLHTDQHPLMPATVQILVCVRQAADPISQSGTQGTVRGGSNLFVDVWHALERMTADRSVPDEDEELLLDRLFRERREIAFHNLVWFAPTVSLRAGQLLCVHNGFQRLDPVGRAFQDRVVDRAPLVHMRLEPGDVLVNNNHRMLHGRRAFSDPERHLVRLLVWLPASRSFTAPPSLLLRARAVAAETARLLAAQPRWVQARLGAVRAVAMDTMARPCDDSPPEEYTADDLAQHYQCPVESDEILAELRRVFHALPRMGPRPERA